MNESGVKYLKTKNEFDQYLSSLHDWRKDIKEDADFFWGKQWSSRDKSILESRGHAPLVINRIFPIIEQKKAYLGQANPSFVFLARGNGDERFADAMSQIARMIWDTSQASSEFMDVLHNRSVYGVGYFLPYYNQNALLGEGSIEILSIHPLDVIFDPNIKKQDFSDAKSYYIYKELTASQLIGLFPKYAEEIKKLKKGIGTGNDLVGTDRVSADNQTNYGDNVQTDLQFKVDVAERHSPEMIPIYTLLYMDGQKRYMTEKDFQQYSSTVEFKLFVSEGRLNVKKWYKKVTRIQIYADWRLKLFDNVIDVPYPIIVPFVEHNPQNGRFLSDVRMVRSQQMEINKRRSLIIAHLTTQVNTKWIGEEGSVDTQQWANDMAKPSVFLSYRKGYQKPERIASEPIPNGLFQEESESKYDIEYTLGMYDYMMGSAQGAHPTARGIATLSELGNRRLNYAYYKLARSFERLGIQILHFVKNYYTTQRILRVGNNKELYLNYAGDERSVDIQSINVLEYDISVSETTLAPTHRQAKAGMLKEYADQGYIRKSLVTKELDIPDAEKESQVIDEINQLSQQLKMLGEDNKELSQTIRQQERLIKSLERQVELEKFRTELASDVQKTKTAVEVTRKLAEQAKTSLKKKEEKNG